MQGIRLVALFIALLVTGPSRASAQLPEAPPTPSREDVARARDAFVRGMEFAGDRRFEAARREFVHSYSLSGSPVALFNLASTLVSLEQHRDAVDAFERLLANASLDAALRSEAEPMMAQAVTQIARVRLHGDIEGATLRVDRGPPRSLERAPEVVVFDPGSHQLLAQREGAEDWSWRGSLSAGDALDLAVELPASEAAAVVPAESEGLDPYTALGLAIAAGVVIATLVGAFVIDGEAQLSPRTGLVFELP